MRPLEKIVGGSSINFSSFEKLLESIKDQTKEGVKPLITIEIKSPEWHKFIAFFVREIQNKGDGTHAPMREGYLYDCNLPNGFFTQYGECSYPISWPVFISEQDFEQGGVYIIDPNTPLWTYINIFIEPDIRKESGRTKAHEFWKQLQKLQNQ